MAGSLRRHVGAVDTQIRQHAGFHVSVVVHVVTLKVVTAVVDNVPIGVCVEIPSAGIEFFAVVAEHEEAIALDGQVEIAAGTCSESAL